MALTARAVAAVKEPGRYADGGGLLLEVSKTGGKSWALRFMRKGRSRQMGLGPFPAVSLAEARELAEDARRLLKRGVDPIEARRAGEKEGVAKGTTFKEIAEALMASREAGWRNPKSAAQWRASLQAYVYPTIGDTPVAEVDTEAVLACVEPIWRAKPETATRVRGRIEAVLNAAKVRGLRSGDNPAQWRGHLGLLLPPKTKMRRVKHHAALPYAELPEFMAALRTQPGFAARALEFAILTGARTSEALGARWSEIDQSAQIWTIPAERMKGHREHRVPLSAAADQLLEGLLRESDYVFPGAREGRPLSNMALLMTLRRMGRGELTAHGFRATFRDWAAETTTHPGDVVEMALAHTIGNKVEAAYRRGDLFEKRRLLMDNWAAFCMTASLGANVAGAASVARDAGAVALPHEPNPETVDLDEWDEPGNEWEDAIAAFDNRSHAEALIALLRSSDWLCKYLIADLLERHVGKDAASEDMRELLLNNLKAGDVTAATQEALAGMLETGALVKPRGRQRRPVYQVSVSKWRLIFAKEQVTALMDRRRANGQRISLDHAVDEIAPEVGFKPETLKNYILGKHGGIRRQEKRRPFG